MALKAFLQSAQRMHSYPFAKTCASLELLWATYPGMAVAVLFYNSKGLDQANILFVQSTVAIASALFVIPGGYLADKYGVRTVALWVNSLLAVQAIFFWLAKGYWEYQLLALLSGAAWCMTGTLTSSLMSRNLSNAEHEEFSAWGAQARNIGIIGGLVLGGWLVSLGGTDLPFAVQPLIHGLGIVVSLWLPKKQQESVRASHEGAATATLSALRTMGRAVRTVMYGSSQLRWLVLFFAVLHAVTLSSFWFFQPKLESMGVNKTYFDEVYIGRAVTALLLVQIVVWLSNTLSESKLVALLLGSITAGVLSAAFLPGWTGMVIFILTYTFTSGAQSPQERVMVARRLPNSSSRTAQLAVPQAINPLVFTGLSWVFGKVSEGVSVASALLIMGLTTLVLGGGTLLLFSRHAKR